MAMTVTDTHHDDNNASTQSKANIRDNITSVLHAIYKYVNI